MTTPTLLTQGQQYMGGTVQYDSATGQKLAAGGTTYSSPLPSPAPVNNTPSTVTAPIVHQPIGSALNVGNLTQDQIDYNNGLALQGQQLKDAATNTTDEATARANALANMQAQIDSQNQLYADKLRSARVAGEGRLGSDAAVQARRGLLGSSFGGAQTDTVTNENTGIENSINAEKAAAIQAIRTKSNSDMETAATARTAAKQKSTEDYMNFLAGKNTRNATNNTTAAKLILDNGVSIDQLSPDDLSHLLSRYSGTTKESIAAEYAGLKKTQDAANAKAAADAKLEANKSLPASAQEYAYLQSLTPEQQAAYKAYQKENANLKIALPVSAQEYNFALSTGWKGKGDKSTWYDQYQTLDANRRALIAKAGSNPDRILSATEAQSLGVPFGTSASQAYGIQPTKPLTEAQGKDLTYASRLVNANDVLSNYDSTIAKYNSAKWLAYTTAENSTIGNTFVPDEVKQIRQAQRDFSTAILRRESGASISPSEFETQVKQYFTQPDDDAKTIAQKALLRETAINSIKTSAGTSVFPKTQTIAPKLLTPTDVPSGYYQASDGLLYKK